MPIRVIDAAMPLLRRDKSSGALQPDPARRLAFEQHPAEHVLRRASPASARGSIEPAAAFA
jgi:hypothetical protein